MSSIRTLVELALVLALGFCALQMMNLSVTNDGLRTSLEIRQDQAKVLGRIVAARGNTLSRDDLLTIAEANGIPVIPKVEGALYLGEVQFVLQEDRVRDVVID